MTGLDPTKLHTIISVLISSFELLGKAVNFGKRVSRGFANEGIYEVLDFENTLEILDKTGHKAVVKKRMKVKYLQDNILSFTDFAWADGKGPVEYQVSPGVAVDEYKSGYRKNILISLREIRTRGDTDEFNMEWKIQKGFLKPTAFWQIDVDNRFDDLRFKLILPPTRPPSDVFVEEVNRKRTRRLSIDHIRKLPGGKWCVTWQEENPKLYESYILHWTW